MRISRVLLGVPLAAVLAVPAVAVSASAQTAAASGAHYVALGDSYSSGDGAGNYGSSGSCYRSANAYPQQWANANAPASFAFVACSGATTSDVLSSQVSALSASTTLVSISIGGNDVGFASVMETCVLESTSSCENAVAGAEAKVASPLPGELDSVLQTIRKDAPAARIVVLGYPDLYDLSRSSGCIGLSTADRTALDQGADQLDSAVAAAAARNGDTFADVRSQFAGHEICDGSSSWLNSVTWPIEESYHPNASGQELGYLPVFSSAAG
ncbi:MAG: SGNH/GDSL hydrolase family protein [Actinobacteria bacterium]|nr:SGNH/GDSL hydrolase family protein [Actinomycetota bacterium]